MQEVPQPTEDEEVDVLVVSRDDKKRSSMGYRHESPDSAERSIRVSHRSVVGVILHSEGTLTTRGGEEEEEHDLLVVLSIMVAFGGASRRQRVATGAQARGEFTLLYCIYVVTKISTFYVVLNDE
jgi:hypothetical protein